MLPCCKAQILDEKPLALHLVSWAHRASGEVEVHGPHDVNAAIIFEHAELGPDAGVEVE